MKEGQHFLFHIFNTDEKTNLVATRPIEEPDVEQLKLASRHVEQYFSSQNVIQCVFVNRNDALTSIVEMARNYFDREGHPESIMQHASLEVSRKFANTCSYLDHFSIISIDISSIRMAKIHRPTRHGSRHNPQNTTIGSVIVSYI